MDLSVTESDRRRARRDVARALLLSATMHLMAGALVGPARLTALSPSQARETEDVSLRPISIGFGLPKRISPTAARRGAVSALPRRVANDRSSVVAPVQVPSSRSGRKVSEHAAELRKAGLGTPAKGKSPPSDAARVQRLETGADGGPFPAQTSSSSADSARKATLNLQHMIDEIAASAAPATPLRATPDAAAISLEARKGYEELIDPPPEVVSRAIAIISFKRTSSRPDSVVYILRHHRFLGISFCSGWSVVAHPLGGGPPETGFINGPCRGDAELPAWADRLPHVPSRDAPGAPSPGPGS